MKTVILSLVAIALLATSGLYLFNQQSSSDPIYGEYVAWKAKYGKNTNGDFDVYRFGVFSDNYKFVNSFNAQQTGSLRLSTNNIFADLTNQEYSNIIIGEGLREQNLDEVNFVEQKGSDSLPESIDWVSKGAVAPVEDQGSCGSCWAFSVKESLEGVYQIKTGKLEVLSAQQLTDCSSASFGCNGGYQASTYTYTQTNGIQTESSYPYVSGSTGRATPCTYNESDVVFKNTGSAMVSPRNNQNAVLEAVQNQPLSVLVAASGITFQLYSSGVLDSCGTRTDHAILLTGYDQSSSTPYYTCKNSWGTGWGNQGYIQLAMTGDGVGTCAVQSSVAYPTY